MSHQTENTPENLEEFIKQEESEQSFLMSEEQMDQWWNKQLEIIGENGVVLMKATATGAEIRSIADEDWLALVETASFLSGLAGRALGLDLWAEQQLTENVQADLFTRIIDTISTELKMATTGDHDPEDIDFEPPY